MKVLAINGSPKNKGNTAYAIQLVLDELEKTGIETEIITIGNKTIKGCTGCGLCFRNKDEKCVIKGDELNEWIQKMKEADGLIFGSPVYYAALNGTMKAFMDRAFYVAGANKNLFRHKAAAAVVAVRRSGGLPTFNQLNNFINYSEMVVPTANYWNIIHGTMPGDAAKDEEGKQIMRTLGKNMAWVLQMIEATKDTIAKPQAERKIMTNFIR
ncbi:MAG: flavodoxin family protein [Candidatus Cloacimonadales bacterium]